MLTTPTLVVFDSVSLKFPASRPENSHAKALVLPSGVYLTPFFLTIWHEVHKPLLLLLLLPPVSCCAEGF